MTELIVALICTPVGLAIGALLAVLVFFIIKKRNQRVLASADAQAKKILSEAIQNASAIKKEMTKNIVISVILMIVGIVIIKNPIGFMLAGIPYGWAVLNKITPNLFIWMPLVGWVIYFLIKLAISYFIGLVALPIKLFQWISEINKVKKFEEHID